jgi:hypothetical protein
VDDLFPTMRWNGAIIKPRIRVVNAYSKIRINKKNRREITGKSKMVIIYLNSTIGKNEEFKNDLLTFYNEDWNMDEKSKIVICSDADTSFKLTIRTIKNATWFLSKFHTVRFLFTKTKKTKGKNKSYPILKDFDKVKSGYYDFLNGNLNKFIDFVKNQKKQTTNTKLFLNFIKNNVDGTKLWNNSNYGYSAESEVRLIKKLLRDRSRIWTPEIFKQLLNSKGYKVIIRYE